MREIEAISFLLKRGYNIEPSTGKMKRRLIKATIRQLIRELSRLPKQREIAKALRLAQPATISYWWAGRDFKEKRITHSEVWKEIFDSLDIEEYDSIKHKIKDDERKLCLG